jgi:hypothetical protein
MTPLSDSDRTQLQALVGRVIPASAEFGVPGADDPAIFADILRTLAPHLEVVGAMLAGLGDLAAAAPPTIDAVLQGLLTTHTAAMSPVISVVAQCYYRDDRVMLSLDMEARPPFPKGFEIEQGDWSLLDPVRARPRLWRDAPGREADTPDDKL